MGNMIRLILSYTFLYLVRCELYSSHISKTALHNIMTEPELLHYFQTDDKKSVPEYEVLYLPASLPIREGFNGEQESEEIDYKFSVFGRPIDLKLRRNEDILAPSFKTFIHDEDGIKYFNETPVNCHYLHQDENLVAALSICKPKTVQGLIFLDNSTFEIQPLSPKLQRRAKRQATDNNIFFNDKEIPHIIKRAKFESEFLLDDIFPAAGNIWSGNKAIRNSGLDDFIDDDIFENLIDSNLQRRGQIMTVELALFFDEAAYRIFSPYFGYDDKKLQNMLLAYLNGVQALYHHPSLGTSLELVLVRLDIMKTQPREMYHYNGERSQLLDSFCEYQASINPKDDSNPDHWDMGLYVSGLDFYAYENGRKSGVTMGLATVGGVCLDKYACVIAEFGTTNVFGKPYPSAGFTSVYILAHEIGHNLGMHHDNSGNSCPKEGYIMSPSRGTNGETQWSTCSAEIMSKLSWAKCLKDSAKPVKGKDHSRFLDVPGRIYTAKRQCEILLRDKDAVMSPSQQQSDICYNLQCKTPNRGGFYFSGPALDGTPCGSGKYCYGGHCSAKQPPRPVKVVPGGWSKWKTGSCGSGCLHSAKGIQTSTRECNNPVRVNTDEGCEGTNKQFNFCNDDNMCKFRRQSSVQYASKKCKDFSKLLQELDSKGVGLQAPHEDARVWTSCAIFCKRQDSGAFYTPRVELNDLGVSPYFPDGTWCHKDSTGMDYYCIQHHCLPEQKAGHTRDALSCKFCMNVQMIDNQSRVWFNCSLKIAKVLELPEDPNDVQMNDFQTQIFEPSLIRSRNIYNFLVNKAYSVYKNFKFIKNQIPNLDDIPFSQNARPNRPMIPPGMKNYFALGADGRPLQTSFKTSNVQPPMDYEEWETKDYVELPSIKKRFNAMVQEMNDLDFV